MALQILLWFGVSLIVLVIFLVITPIHVVLSWQNDPAKRATVLLRLFGGVSPTIKVYDSSKLPKPDKPARKHSKQKRGQTGRQRWNQRGDILREAVTLLRRALGAIHIDLLHLDVELCLGDPAETGQFYGKLCPLIYTTGGHVTLHPNFGRACLQGTALAKFHFTLLGLLAVCALWLAYVRAGQMTYVLGEPIAFGTYAIAIVSQHVVNGRTVGQHGIGLHCCKTPTYVVVQTAHTLGIFDMAGQAVTLEQATALCPALATL